MTISIQAAVDRLIDARSSRRLLAPMSETDGDFPVAHAYAIQDALRLELGRRGEHAIGWKLGATSPSGQAVMGVTEPACGFLYPAQHASGAAVSAGDFATLAVEAEVAFRMRTRLAGPGVTVESASLAVEGAVAALEVLDFMFSGKPRVSDFIASSIIGRAIVLGATTVALDGLDLDRESVRFEQNGEAVGTYTSAEVMDNPLNALVWLANHLATRRLALNAGDVVMSGAISKMVRPKVGDTLCARFAHLGTVEMSVAP